MYNNDQFAVIVAVNRNLLSSSK